ncbi:MAG TPA: HIT domain-containing protein [Chloroflexota bacterium]|nr:HIT domain-containing protein [Chloroflexota bacterium]
METLWAPWRLEYIKGPKAVGCIFCAALAANDDPENLIVWRGETCFVMLNRYPYNNGHLMVVPYAHRPGIDDLSAEIVAEFMALTQRAIGVLRDAIAPTGFNIGINQGVSAGAGVADHVHLHVVPRWIGDTNFMPVLGATRVLPESLASSYRLLAGGFARARAVTSE